MYVSNNNNNYYYLFIYFPVYLPHNYGIWILDFPRPSVYWDGTQRVENNRQKVA